MSKKRQAGGQPPQRTKIDDAQKAKLVADNVVRLCDLVATALAAAEELGVATKPLENLQLSPAQRELLLALPAVPKGLKAKVRKAAAPLTAADVAGLVTGLANGSTETTGEVQYTCLLFARQLIDRLRVEVTGTAEPKPKKAKKPKAKAARSTKTTRT